MRSQSTSLHCMHHSNTVSHDDIIARVFCACMNRMLHRRTQHTTVMSQLCHIASRCRASQSTHSINKSIVNDQSTNRSHQIASTKGHLMMGTVKSKSIAVLTASPWRLSMSVRKYERRHHACVCVVHTCESITQSTSTSAVPAQT